MRSARTMSSRRQMQTMITCTAMSTRIENTSISNGRCANSGWISRAVCMNSPGTLSTSATRRPAKNKEEHLQWEDDTIELEHASMLALNLSLVNIFLLNATQHRHLRCLPEAANLVPRLHPRHEGA